VRETVEGQQHRRLRPQEELTTLICTDPDDHVARLLASARGPLLWRVQVRRGLVPVRDREVSSTAVIGVEFEPDQIQRPKG
jgi:hypothetical protein